MDNPTMDFLMVAAKTVTFTTSKPQCIVELLHDALTGISKKSKNSAVFRLAEETGYKTVSNWRCQKKRRVLTTTLHNLAESWFKNQSRLIQMNKLESFHPIESALEIAVIAYSQVSASERSGNNSVLANHPDITLIKKEKTDGPVNNNSDHSESGSDNQHIRIEQIHAQWRKIEAGVNQFANSGYSDPFSVKLIPTTWSGISKTKEPPRKSTAACRKKPLNCRQSIKSVQSSILIRARVQPERFYLVIDPISKHWQIHVNTRCIVFAASDSPSNNSHLVVPVLLSLYRAYQWTTSISFARVLTRNSSSAHERLMKLEVQDSHIIIQRACIVLRMSYNCLDFTILMWEQFLGMLGIPFTCAYLKHLVLSANAMRSSYHHLGMDQRSTTLVNIQDIRVSCNGFFSKHSHHPGKFSKFGFVFHLAFDPESNSFFVTAPTSHFFYNRRSGSNWVGCLIFLFATDFDLAVPLVPPVPPVPPVPLFPLLLLMSGAAVTLQVHSNIIFQPEKRIFVDFAVHSRSEWGIYTKGPTLK
ncbi:hypothetical protein HUJ04_010076 [Dendroctonus ponderosae]|nr:hypothetical protein HUJ04_010076 [Dendroctonus ponderosae]